MTRIGLLVAIPCTWQAFQQAVYDPRREWLAGAAADPHAHWQGGYEQDVARPLWALADACAAMGASVVHGAGLADVLRASESCDVVVVVAHWKGTAVLARDLIVADGTLIAERLRSDEDLCRVAAALKAEMDAGNLAAALHAHVHADQVAAPQVSGFTVTAHPDTWAAMRRDQLDRILAGVLRPGNRLELADGLADAATVERMLAPGFCGTLDLTSCRARPLADHIDRARLGQCGVVQFEHAVEPETAALALHRALELCLVFGVDYDTAREQALLELAQRLAVETRERPLERVAAWLHDLLGRCSP